MIIFIGKNEVTIGVCLMKEEMAVGLEMGKEELDELLKNLPQILQELEQYITDNNSYSL